LSWCSNDGCCRFNRVCLQVVREGNEFIQNWGNGERVVPNRGFASSGQQPSRRRNCKGNPRVTFPCSTRRRKGSCEGRNGSRRRRSPAMVSSRSVAVTVGLRILDFGLRGCTFGRRPRRHREGRPNTNLHKCVGTASAPPKPLGSFLHQPTTRRICLVAVVIGCSLFRCHDLDGIVSETTTDGDDTNTREQAVLLAPPSHGASRRLAGKGKNSVTSRKHAKNM
jgi:hypothetical protein